MIYTLITKLSRESGFTFTLESSLIVITNTHTISTIDSDAVVDHLRGTVESGESKRTLALVLSGYMLDACAAVLTRDGLTHGLEGRADRVGEGVRACADEWHGSDAA